MKLDLRSDDERYRCIGAVCTGIGTGLKVKTLTLQLNTKFKKMSFKSTNKLKQNKPFYKFHTSLNHNAL